MVLAQPSTTDRSPAAHSRAIVQTRALPDPLQVRLDGTAGELQPSASIPIKKSCLRRRDGTIMPTSRDVNRVKTSDRKHQSAPQ